MERQSGDPPFSTEVVRKNGDLLLLIAVLVFLNFLADCPIPYQRQITRITTSLLTGCRLRAVARDASAALGWRPGNNAATSSLQKDFGSATAVCMSAADGKGLAGPNRRGDRGSTGTVRRFVRFCSASPVYSLTD